MKAFAGMFIALLLIGTIIQFEEILQENQKNLLESKQRLIEYQKIGQERIEFMKDFEKKASISVAAVIPRISQGIDSKEAEGIFCSSLLIQTQLNFDCFTKFEFDTLLVRAKLKQQLVLEKENYKITFQKGGYFNAKP